MAFEAHQAGEPFKKFVDEIIPHVIDPPILVIPFTESTISIAESDRS